MKTVSVGELLTGMLFALVVGLIVGASIAQRYSINSAVRSGAAEWFLDEDNDKVWRWKHVHNTIQDNPIQID